MQQEQAKPTKMSCPACGFQVFNRRYPKCERCDSYLPASLVYSDQERQALLQREAEWLILDLKNRESHRLRKASRRQQTLSALGLESLALTPTADGGTVSTSESFVSGGGGVFDGGGASSSFGGDSGGSSSSSG